MKNTNIIITILATVTLTVLTNNKLSAQGCPQSFSIAGNGAMTLTFASGADRSTIISINIADHTTGDTIFGITGSNTGSKAWKANGTFPASYETSSNFSIHVVRGTAEGDTNYCGFSAGALPIELMYFNAELKGNTTLLTWATASEENNSHFTIERSIDNKNWEVVGVENGAGNSINMLKYEMTDYTPVYGTVYYRLRQDDYNGDFTYSNTVVVTTDENHKLNIMGLYIENNNLRVSLEGASQNEPIEVKIFNLNGSVQSNTTINSGEMSSNQVNMDVSALTDGVYTITITQGNEVVTGKFIK